MRTTTPYEIYQPCRRGFIEPPQEAKRYWRPEFIPVRLQLRAHQGKRWAFTTRPEPLLYLPGADFHWFISFEGVENKRVIRPNQWIRWALQYCIHTGPDGRFRRAKALDTVCCFFIGTGRVEIRPRPPEIAKVQHALRPALQAHHAEIQRALVLLTHLAQQPGEPWGEAGPRFQAYDWPEPYDLC